MRLSELRDRINCDGPYEWVDPQLVDLDTAFVKELNRRKWFCKYDLTEDSESEDEVITDYLYECLLEQKNLTDSGKIIPPELNVNAVMLVRAGIYMISNLGSSYAATHLSSWRELLTASNSNQCFDLLSEAYKKSDSFAQDILRDFILGLFQYGPFWESPDGVFSIELGDKKNAFLKAIYERGYCTIDNEDLRLFVDKSKRF